MFKRKQKFRPVITGRSLIKNRHAKSKPERPQKPPKSPRNFFQSVREWPIRMIQEMHRIKWIGKGSLLKRFLVTIGFVALLSLIFALFNELMLVVLQHIHVL